jgi:hypothetical protein
MEEGETHQAVLGLDVGAFVNELVNAAELAPDDGPMEDALPFLWHGNGEGAARQVW